MAYTQYLESYHTVELSSMAATFGLRVGFLDNELSELVACGRLSCKIDKVKGVVCRSGWTVGDTRVDYGIDFLMVAAVGLCLFVFCVHVLRIC